MGSRRQAVMTITVTPLSGALGAEIGNVDVSADLDDGTIADIRQALLEHQVIFFRDQGLDMDRHRAFTLRFGDLFIHPNFQLGQENSEFVMVRRQPGDKRIIGEDWHTDTTMIPTPPMGAILYAIAVPDVGGDTLFANQYLAYEALSDGMKDMLDGLQAVHNDSRVAGPGNNLNANAPARCARTPTGNRPRTNIPSSAPIPKPGASACS
jgi:taurine dioxygenase